MVEFKCQRCGYETIRLSNFKNHLNRKFSCKPIISNTSIKNIKKFYNFEEDIDTPEISSKIPIVSSNIYPKNEDNTICEYCSKKLSSYKNKWRHQKTCKAKSTILDQNIILQKQNNALLEQVDQLIKKVSFLEKSSLNNNFKNNNINSFNKIQVNNYGCENIDYITDKVFKKLLNTPLSAIPKLIELKYFNPEHPENHNIKITNIHDKFAKIYKDNKWLVSHKKDVIADLVDNGYADFEEFKDLNEEEVKEKIKEKYKIMEEYYLENSENLYKKSEVAIINGTNKLNKSEEIEV